MKKPWLFFLILAGTLYLTHAQSDLPNIIIILTDDQGYGDFGFTGNPHVKTPVIDLLAKESIRFHNFYVSPVCAPTRSSLMTGRYSLRTGIRDTYNGGAIMATEEITIAEMLKDQGYQTGIFGKWHLGDNFPCRPGDQGFDESLVHLSGGMGQVGDITTYFKYDSSYFDPVFWHNGRQEAYKGYCSDVFTDAAISFIKTQRDNPFFCYLSFNAPHTPLQLPEQYYQMYADIDPGEGFNQTSPDMSEKDKEDARKVYGMVSNIDDNLDRLFQVLKQEGLEENTLVIFFTDNGPQQRRFVANLRGRKGSVYEGGIKVPFLFKFPGLAIQNKDIYTPAAHIDILPTLAEILGLSLPLDRKIDGRSLLPLMAKNETYWPDRSLFFYWTRKYPERYQNMAVRRGDYKLVGHTDFNAAIDSFELFNLVKDPYEQKNLVKENATLGQELKEEIDQYYRALILEANIQSPPNITIGALENPTFLNRNDAGGNRGIWSQEEIFGQWNVRINAGSYNLEVKFIEPVPGNGKLVIEANQIVHQMHYRGEETDIILMEKVDYPAMDATIIPFYQVDGRRIFPFWIAFEKVE